MSVFARKFRSRRRWPTSNSSPRRLWWSCLCSLRCSVRSRIRWDSSATCTSGEPVSPSAEPYSAMIRFLTSWANATDDSFVSVQPRSTGLGHGGRLDAYCVWGAHWTHLDALGYQLVAREQFPRLRHVDVHLADQRVDAVEPLHPAQPCDELDAERRAVKVAVEVEHKRLHPALADLERGIGTHRDGGHAQVAAGDGATPLVQPDHPAGVDAVGGHRRPLFAAQVRGGKARGPATLVTALDDAVDPMGAAQHGRRGLHVTCSDAGADVGGAQYRVVRGE